VDNKLSGTVAVVTGASSGIGEATARQLAELGAAVVLVARRKERLDALVSGIERDGGTAFALEADITDRRQAEAAVQGAVERFGRVDILVNNAGLMLVAPVDGADLEGWERMIAVNQKGLLYMTNAALPHLLSAADSGDRGVADIVNISSEAGRRSMPHYAVYNMTKFGVNGFTEALRQEITRRHVRVGVLEPGAVATELVTHNSGDSRATLDAFFEKTIVLDPQDIADGVAFMVTRPPRASVPELFIMPTDQP
jgi:NADP-dependent 3-hydroxy acid dehydrogenase YdfG